MYSYTSSLAGTGISVGRSSVPKDLTGWWGKLGHGNEWAHSKKGYSVGNRKNDSVK